MFTRCPECETTFRLGAEDLRRAKGKVRCGDCGEVFNALEFLAEETETSAAEPEWSDAQPTSVDLITSDELSDEADAYEISAVQEDSEPGADKNDASDDSIEYAFDDYATSGDDAEPGAGVLASEAADNFAIDDDEAPYDADSEFGAVTTDDTDSEVGNSWLANESEPAEEATEDTTSEISAAADIDLSDAANNDWDTPDSPLFDATNEHWADSTDSETLDISSDTAEEATTVQNSTSFDLYGRAEPIISEDADEDADNELDSTDHYDLNSSDDDFSSQTVTFLDNEDTDNATTEDIDLEAEEAIEIVAQEDEQDLSDEDEYFDDSVWERIPGVGSDAPVDSISKEQSFFRSDSAEEDEDDETDSTDNESAGDEPDDVDSAIKASDNFVDDFEPIKVTRAESTLEFNAPQDTWSSIFADSASKSAKPSAANAADEWSIESSENIWSADNSHDNETNDATNELTRIFGSSNAASEENNAASAEAWEDPPEDLQDSTDGAPTNETSQPFNESEYDVQHIILQDESAPVETTLSNNEADEGAPPWQLNSYENPPEQKSRNGLWALASIAILSALTAQLIHYNRDTLAANTAWGERVRGVYSQLNLELFPEWDIADYEIRGSEAVAGETGPDIMDIRAQIATIGDQPTGLPYLRVVLRDRWSNPVAAKHFAPSEYAESSSLPASGIMTPNSTVAAHVTIVDPGSGAQGFELELCLPRRHTGLDCTGQPFN